MNNNNINTHYAEQVKIFFVIMKILCIFAPVLCKKYYYIKNNITNNEN